MRNEVDAFGGAACENNFVRRICTDMFFDCRARIFISSRSFLAEVMNAAMNVCVVVGIIINNGINDGFWLLCGSAVVEIDEGFSVYCTGKYWKISTKTGNIVVHDFFFRVR